LYLAEAVEINVPTPGSAKRNNVYLDNLSVGSIQYLRQALASYGLELDTKIKGRPKSDEKFRATLENAAREFPSFAVAHAPGSKVAMEVERAAGRELAAELAELTGRNVVRGEFSLNKRTIGIRLRPGEAKALLEKLRQPSAPPKFGL
jgi:hypothetical protein